MKEFIIILLSVCNTPDTLIIHNVKENKATYTYDLRDKKVQKRVEEIMKTDPILIWHEDERGLCTSF